MREKCKKGHESEGCHLRGEVNQVVEYQVKSTSLNEVLYYITLLIMKCYSVTNNP